MDKIRINDRLMTAIPLVRRGRRFADIGTDHAYLPIYLLQNDLIGSAIAADINRGPLDKAEENIKKFGLEDKIRTVLCDGLSGIGHTEADDIAVFGMGGELIIQILDEAPWLKNTEKRLILQPMTHPEKLREYLAKNGFKILGESLCIDREKIYQTICAEYDGVCREFDEFTLLFGEHNLKEKSELLHSLMLAEKKKLIRKMMGKKEGNESIEYEQKMLVSIEKYIER